MTVLTRQQYIEQRVQLAVEIADMDWPRLGVRRNRHLAAVALRERERAERAWKEGVRP